MYVYRIIDLQNIIEPEASGEKTCFYIENKYIVSTNQDIGGDNAVELLELTDQLKQDLYALNPINEFSTVLEKLFFIIELRQQHVQCIKDQAYARITAIYPITKQLNLIYAQAFEQDAYAAMVAFIENIRMKSNALELKIAKYTVKQLETFDCSDDKHWAD